MVYRITVELDFKEGDLIFFLRDFWDILIEQGVMENLLFFKVDSLEKEKKEE